MKRLSDSSDVFNLSEGIESWIEMRPNLGFCSSSYHPSTTLRLLPMTTVLLKTGVLIVRSTDSP